MKINDEDACEAQGLTTGHCQDGQMDPLADHYETNEMECDRSVCDAEPGGCASDCVPRAQSRGYGIFPTPVDY